MNKKNIFIVSLGILLIILAIVLVRILRSPEVIIEEKSEEEIMIEKQTEELNQLMKEFSPLTGEEIEKQTQELENLFNEIR